MTHYNDGGERSVTTLYHYTCDDGRRAIGDEGELRPHAYGVVWLTDLELPFREALGLTSYMLSCDRTQHRYRVTDDSTCIPWTAYAKRDRTVEIEGTKPMHWWISEDPVPVVYDPHRITSMDELLAPEERLRMRSQLADMARLRRRAESEAGGIWMP